MEGMWFESGVGRIYCTTIKQDSYQQRIVFSSEDAKKKNDFLCYWLVVKLNSGTKMNKCQRGETMEIST